jgi:hypothetical protein
MINELQQGEVVNEITAWWQKALGTKAVLGQASNRPPPGPRAPIPELLWTKPESGQVQQERTAIEATPRPTKEEVAKNPGTQEPKRQLGMDRALSALGQIKHWSGGMISGAVYFLAVAFLRLVVAVFETIRSALGILTVEFRRVKRWSHSIRGLVAANESQPGKPEQWKSHAATPD